MNYDSNSNINSFIGNNANKRNRILKSYKLDSYTPSVLPALSSHDIQNNNSVELGTPLIIKTYSIRNSNIIKNEIPFIVYIDEYNIQNTNLVTIGTPLFFGDSNIQNSNNINLGPSIPLFTPILSYVNIFQNESISPPIPISFVNIFQNESITPPIVEKYVNIFQNESITPPPLVEKYVNIFQNASITPPAN